MAFAVAPEFGAGHVEDAPAGPPADGVFGAVGLRDEGEEFVLVIVRVAEPSLGGFLVVLEMIESTVVPSRRATSSAWRMRKSGMRYERSDITKCDSLIGMAGTK